MPNFFFTDFHAFHKYSYEVRGVHFLNLFSSHHFIIHRVNFRYNQWSAHKIRIGWTFNDLANFHMEIPMRHWPKVNSKVLRVSFYFYSFTELWEKESLIILSSPQLFKKVANAFPVHFNHIDKSNSHLIRALKFLAPLQIKLRTYFLNQISTARIFILSKRETGIL